MPILTAQISPAGPIVRLGVLVSVPRAEALKAANVPVLGADLSQQGIQALIGRDVLANGAFWYNGQGGTLSLAF